MSSRFFTVNQWIPASEGALLFSCHELGYLNREKANYSVKKSVCKAIVKRFDFEALTGFYRLASFTNRGSDFHHSGSGLFKTQHEAKKNVWAVSFALSHLFHWSSFRKNEVSHRDVDRNKYQKHGRLILWLNQKIGKHYWEGFYLHDVVCNTMTTCLYNMLLFRSLWIKKTFFSAASPWSKKFCDHR